MKGFWKKTVMIAALAGGICLAEGMPQEEDRIIAYASSAATIDSSIAAGSGNSSVTTTESSLNVTINYLEETITILGNGSKVYISTNKGKTWEYLESSEVSKYTLELSCYMKTAETVLYFKKAGEEVPYILTIPKEEKTLKAKYVVTNAGGTVELSYAAGTVIEYRKGTNGDWKEYTSSFSTKPYENTGYTLQFRSKATPTQRAGKIVNVKIAKRPTAPIISVDYSDLCLKGLKNGTTEYRLSTASEWTTFNAVSGQSSLLDLYTVLNSTMASVDKTSTLLKAGSIEVRTKAMGKKLASAVRLIEIPAQHAAPDTTVTLKDDTLVISDASAKKPYEYTIIHQGETFDISKVTWKKVTSSKGTSIKKFGSATTVTGDVLYVRMASYKDTAAGTISVASLPKKINVSITAAPTPTVKP